MSKTKMCPECGGEIQCYDLDGSIRAASEDDELWAESEDLLETDYGACTVMSHAFCIKCHTCFNPTTGKKYVDDPMVCLRRLAEHCMQALEKDMIPLPLRSVQMQAVAKQVAESEEKLLEQSDPEMLP